MKSRSLESKEEMRRYICDKVWRLCHEMIAGNVSDNLLYLYGVSNEYLDVCRDTSHPLSKKLTDELFRHIMFVIGYYYTNGDDDKLIELSDSIDDKLMNPIEPKDRKLLHLPKMLYGVRSVLERIGKFSSANLIEFDDEKKVSDLEVSKELRTFKISYSRDPEVSIALEDASNPVSVKLNAERVTISANGRHISDHQIRLTEPDKVTVSVDSFQTCSVDAESTFFFRYITEVDRIPSIQGHYDYRLMDVDGMDIPVIDTIVDDNQLNIFFTFHASRKYLVIEYDKPLNVKDMQYFCFSVIVALGMLTCDVHLNDCWLAAYDSVDRKSETGLFYRGLAGSFSCNYGIYTNNVFSRLVPAATKIDPKNGERRAIDIINRLRLYNAIEPFSRDVLGCLINNLNKFEKLQRGIFIILICSQYSLEIQAAAYCVALEAIASLPVDGNEKKEKRLIDDSDRWEIVRKRFLDVTRDLSDSGIISDEEKRGLEKKIDGMNTNFNAEKLKTLLKHYKYPMKEFDNLTLSLRNPLLHGSIEFKKMKGEKADNLFALSLNLHKLCCAIALLMSGYRGYIVNNRNLYGYPHSGTAFINLRVR